MKYEHYKALKEKADSLNRISEDYADTLNKIAETLGVNPSDEDFLNDVDQAVWKQDKYNHLVLFDMIKQQNRCCDEIMKEFIRAIRNLVKYEQIEIKEAFEMVIEATSPEVTEEF